MIKSNTQSSLSSPSTSSKSKSENIASISAFVKPINGNSNGNGNIIENQTINTNSPEYISINNDDDTKTQIVTRLEDIYKKYKNIFEPDDSTDFEIIIETLKNNLLD